MIIRYFVNFILRVHLLLLQLCIIIVRNSVYAKDYIKKLLTKQQQQENEQNNKLIAILLLNSKSFILIQVYKILSMLPCCFINHPAHIAIHYPEAVHLFVILTTYERHCAVSNISRNGGICERVTGNDRFTLQTREQ